MSLHISLRMPDRELDKSPIDVAANQLAMWVGLSRRDGALPTGGPALDLTFLLTTVTEQPDFQGLRMGGYAADVNTLYFESAVPAHLTHSPHAQRYLLAVLLDVFDNAADFFSDKQFADKQLTDKPLTGGLLPAPPIAFDRAQWYGAVAGFPGMAALLQASA